MQEYFSISLILTQHLNRKLGAQPGVTLSKVSRYKRGLSLEENNHILLCDLGGTMGIDLDYSGRRNPAITSMNYMKYNFGTFNHQDMSNISKLRRALSFANFPYMNCNITHPSTKEPFFGEPYELFVINGMKLVILSGYGGTFVPEGEKKNRTLHVSDLGSSVKRWLRYIYDSEDPDYVIVCISDWDEEFNDIIKDMEGVGMLITGSHAPEDEGEDGSDGGPGREKQTYENFPVPEGGPVSLHHHQHSSRIMHISLNFKTRTSTYEYLGHTVSAIDREVAQLSEDYNLLDLVHYHL